MSIYIAQRYIYWATKTFSVHDETKVEIDVIAAADTVVSVADVLDADAVVDVGGGFKLSVATSVCSSSRHCRGMTPKRVGTTDED